MYRPFCMVGPPALYGSAVEPVERRPQFERPPDRLERLEQKEEEERRAGHKAEHDPCVRVAKGAADRGPRKRADEGDDEAITS